MVIVRPAGPDDIAEVAAVVAAAFADEPYWCWAVPDRDRRARAVAAFYGADLADLVALGLTDVAVDGDRVVAAGVWCRSGDLPSEAHGLAAVAAVDAEAAAAGGRALAAMSGLAPAEPHLYLDVLAVAPGRQGTGLGSRTLAAGLARADAAGAPCYLETTRPANLPLYERHGFTVRTTLAWEDLRVWGLLRPSRPFVRPGTSLV